MKILFTAAALLLSGSFSEAGSVPSELVGSWGDSPAQCRSFHRKFQDVTEFDAGNVSWCGGSSCQAEVLSSKVTADGYILKTRAKISGLVREVIMTRVQKGVFESEGDALVKCGEADKIAGIGRPGDAWDEQKATSAAFSAFYAMETQKVCPKLQIDTDKATSIATIGMTEYFQFLANLDFEVSDLMSPDNQMKDMKRDVAYAVEEDSTQITDFCGHLVDVFGPKGNLLPGLISDGSENL